MQNIYRETFEQIHASEQLRKEVANVPKQEKAAFRHRISKAGLIAAALALAGTVLAAVSYTHLSMSDPPHVRPCWSG